MIISSGVQDVQRGVQRGVQPAGRDNGGMAAFPRDTPSEPRRPITPAEREAEIVRSLLDHLRLVNEGVAHVTDRDHICACVYPPDWVDFDGILADQLEGVRMCTEDLCDTDTSRSTPDPAD